MSQSIPIPHWSVFAARLDRVHVEPAVELRAVGGNPLHHDPLPHHGAQHLLSQVRALGAAQPHPQRLQTALHTALGRCV